jgi:hypothetical protein
MLLGPAKVDARRLAHPLDVEIGRYNMLECSYFPAQNWRFAVEP